MFKLYSNFFWLSLLTFLFLSCKKKEEFTPVEVSKTAFSFTKPEGFPNPHYTFPNNPLSKEGFELGRFLFYDPILSVDSSRSCNSCHAQAHAFADHNIPLSKGVHNIFGTRNAPALSNLAWSTSFMWDGGVNHIEVQPLVPIQSAHEMGETILNVVYKLNKSSFYKTKFKQAFNVDTITDQKVLHALAQFTGMLVSANSKYDQYRAGKVAFTDEESKGYKLFKNNCAICHTEPLFTDYSFRNSGLESEIIDNGRERVSQDVEDKGKFKVPSLRNIEYTYPYMHDGRFMNLEQVLEFKVNGIKDSPTLDPFLKKGIKLSKEEQNSVIAFLKTLTDFEYIGNPKFAEPKR